MGRCPRPCEFRAGAKRFQTARPERNLPHPMCTFANKAFFQNHKQDMCICKTSFARVGALLLHDHLAHSLQALGDVLGHLLSFGCPTWDAALARASSEQAPSDFRLLRSESFGQIDVDGTSCPWDVFAGPGCSKLQFFTMGSFPGRF